MMIMEEEKKISASVFAVRTTAGQEKNVANLIAARVEMSNLPIKAILVPECGERLADSG